MCTVKTISKLKIDCQLQLKRKNCILIEINDIGIIVPIKKQCETVI